MAIIEANAITKDFGGMKALDGVTIIVEDGAFYGFFGPNGAGKTTLIRILTGQLEQTSGTVSVLGVDVAKEPMRVKEVIGIVPEVEGPPSYLTASEYLYFVGMVRKLDKLDDRIEKWLSFFDLEGKKGTICKDMSKGMRQKLGIAIAIMKDAEVILLDEPTSGLDPKSGAEFLQLLAELRGEGKAIWMTTHDIFRAKEISDRVGIMLAGKLVKLLTRQELEHADLEKLYVDYVSQIDQAA